MLTVEISPTSIKATRRIFCALCCYILAQAYMIPILPIGPWPIWPAFADFAAALLVVALFLDWRSLSPLGPANRTLLQVLLIVLGGWLISFSYFVVSTHPSMGAMLPGVFNIYRLVEFICIFVAVALIPVTNARRDILRRLVDVAIASIAISMVLIYFAILPLSLLTAHLPQSPGVAGPWSGYATRASIGLTSEGFSIVGYNHSYVTVQLLALVALRIYLAGRGREATNTFFLILAIVGCFLSGSRNGLFAILLFAAVYWLRRPQLLVLLATLSLGVWLALPLFGVQFLDQSLATAVARQKTLLAATDPDNLSGRGDIWQSKLAFLDAQPLRWLIGAGLGVQTTAGLSQNAHMLYLQIIIDTGLIGLALFLLIAVTVLVNLWLYESQPHAIFWVSLALLVSSLTQETFYPVSALGHFLGLYLCCLALALHDAGSRAIDRPEWVPLAAAPNLVEREATQVRGARPALPSLYATVEER